MAQMCFGLPCHRGRDSCGCCDVSVGPETELSQNPPLLVALVGESAGMRLLLFKGPEAQVLMIRSLKSVWKRKAVSIRYGPY